MGVLEPTVIVMVERPEPGAGMEAGRKRTVVPVGMPLADSAIALLKPPLIVVVMVEVPGLPRTIASEDGAAETAKLAAAVTVRVTVAMCRRLPPVPVTVMV
jgi:hypothetical protein